MEFTLFYRGPLKPNGGPKDKQEIRRVIHPQLKALWDQEPLKHYKHKLVPVFTPAEFENIAVGNFHCIPLVFQKIRVVAALNITFLRPEPPGNIITEGGDIDNRIKTLLDALQVPKDNQLSQDDVPTADETPFFCLLEDDNLVTEISIKTDRLLVSNDDKEVVLLIHVTTKRLVTTFGNVDFG